MELISTVNVGAGGLSSINFTGIPQTYTDLSMSLSIRSSATASFAGPLFLRINGITSTTAYKDVTLVGSGSSTSVYSTYSSGLTYLYLYNLDQTANTSANCFTNHQFFIPNYTQNGDKSISISGVWEHFGTAYQNITAAGVIGANAVTSISIFGPPTFLQYSTISLYGILKGSGGANVA